MIVLVGCQQVRLSAEEWVQMLFAEAFTDKFCAPTEAERALAEISLRFLEDMDEVEHGDES